MPSFTTPSAGFGAILTGTPNTGVHSFWNDALTAPNGDVWQYPQQLYKTVAAQTIVGRGAPQYRLSRVFGWFDLTAYAPNITSIEFELEGIFLVYNAPQLAIICESYAYANATSATLNPNDFQVGVGWDPGITYSSASPLSNSTFVIQGNATAVAAANAQGYINIAVIQYDNDFNGVSPGITSTTKGGDIDLDPTVNFSNGVFSTGYANIVNGFNGVDISNVNNISSADINVVIGM